MKLPWILLCVIPFACSTSMKPVKDSYRIALVQFDTVPEQNARNVRAIERLSREAAGKGAEIIMFHEGSVTDYISDMEKYSEYVPDGPSSKAIESLAKELGVFISYGISEKTPDKRYYITQAFMGPEGFVYKYRKTWLFRGGRLKDGTFKDEGYRNEHKRYDCGPGPELFYIGGLKAACFICADGSAGRCIDRARLLKPDIVFYPNNRGSYLGDNEYFRKIAADIGAPVLVANRIGKSWVHDCKGGCAVISGSGEILANTPPHAHEEILIFDLPVKRIES